MPTLGPRDGVVIAGVGGHARSGVTERLKLKVCGSNLMAGQTYNMNSRGTKRCSRRRSGLFAGVWWMYNCPGSGESRRSGGDPEAERTEWAGTAGS